MSFLSEGIEDDNEVMGIDLALKKDQWERLESNKREVLSNAWGLKKGLDKDITSVTTALYVVGGSLATIAVVYAASRLSKSQREKAR